MLLRALLRAWREAVGATTPTMQWGASGAGSDRHINLNKRHVRLPLSIAGFGAERRWEGGIFLVVSVDTSMIAAYIRLTLPA